jgi:hypothetical protein
MKQLVYFYSTIDNWHLWLEHMNLFMETLVPSRIGPLFLTLVDRAT